LRTVTYQSVLEGVLRRLGQDPASASLERLLQVNEAIADRYRDAVEYYRWPEFMRLEERRYRNTWADGTYAAGAEVWHAATATYWKAPAGATAGQVPGTASQWEALSGAWERYVAYEQVGLEAIGAVLGAWDRNPRSDPAARRLSYRMTERGVSLPPADASLAPASAWVAYRTREEDFAWRTVWAADGVYAPGDRVYFAPEVWECVETTTAGQSPTTHAAKWRALAMPHRLARAIKAGARAMLLGALGQEEKEAGREPGFDVLLEEQVWQLTKLQGQTGTPTSIPPGQ
jgi:hypothetical protein